MLPIAAPIDAARSHDSRAACRRAVGLVLHAVAGLRRGERQRMHRERGDRRFEQPNLYQIPQALPASVPARERIT